MLTGLDPSGPSFRGTKPQVHLNKGDAALVDVLNTNGGKFSRYRLGMFLSIGHINIYVNGGKKQPGCKMSAKTAMHALFEIFRGKTRKTKALVKSKITENIIFIPRQTILSKANFSSFHRLQL